MFMVLDLETTGLWRKDRGMPDETQPKPIQVSAAVCERDGTVLEAVQNLHVQPGRTWTIDPGAEAVHGISLQTAERLGVSEMVALGLLVGMAAKVSTLVRYGDMDTKIVLNRLLLAGKSTATWLRPQLRIVDVMEIATAPCNRQKDDGSLRWPKLSEAVETILGRSHVGAHTSWCDMLATRDLFVALRDRGFVEDL